MWWQFFAALHFVALCCGHSSVIILGGARVKRSRWVENSVEPSALLPFHHSAVGGADHCSSQQNRQDAWWVYRQPKAIARDNRYPVDACFGQLTTEGRSQIAIADWTWLARLLISARDSPATDTAASTGAAGRSASTSCCAPGRRP